MLEDAEVREGIKKIGNSLLGIDPTNLSEVNIQMDRNLKGHNYLNKLVKTNFNNLNFLKNIQLILFLKKSSIF